MIKVRHLTKTYVRDKALDDVSFTVNDGEILGLLGPNGAGKSTTMNIITGYLSCDSGSVEIQGTDMLEEPTKAKKKIGYLPEVPPLYSDMTVQKYLEFMFSLKKVRLPMKEHINTVCEKTNITSVREKLISSLSKGYRQRVGLAQALLGDPPVLILDEPTVGLDPEQIIEIRRLIRELGKDHSVILSSHLLSEVQAVSDKIVIINKGRIVAEETTSTMTQSGKATNRLFVEAECRKNTMLTLLKNIDGVTGVKYLSETERGCHEFVIDSSRDVRRLVFKAIARTDFSILKMQPAERSLEDTYLGIISGSAAPADEKAPDNKPDDKGSEQTASEETSAEEVKEAENDDSDI